MPDRDRPDRVRVAITTDSGGITSVDRLAQLLEALDRYGPEPEGIVVEIHPAALDELPPAWTVEELAD